MRKRALSFTLILALFLILLPMTVQAADMPFSDVPTGAWYYNDVKSAYESGLINGKSSTAFAPDENLTYAESVKLAACMHQKYTTGSVTLKNGSPWYQSYVDYAKEKGIISSDYNWGSTATRAGYMEIFAKSLPDRALAKINDVSDGAIPDVPMSHLNADAIYKLYRAGVVQGSDEQRNCNPGANIQRSEVAAILTRMMTDSARVSFKLVSEDVETPEVSLKTPAGVYLEYFKEGVFEVQAAVDDGGTLTYRWEISYEGYDWAPLANGGADSAIGLDTPSLKSSFGFNAAQYLLRCRVTNTLDDLTAVGYSRTITVNMVGADTPKIIERSLPRASLKYFTQAHFEIEATVNDGGKLTYCWEISYEGYGWSPLTNGGADSVSGIESPKLSISFGTNAEKYQLRCKVTNTKNGYATEAYSPVITVNMYGAQTPRVTLNVRTPTTMALKYSESAIFIVHASVIDGGTLTYQWEISYGAYDWFPLSSEGTTERTGTDSQKLTSSFGTNASQYLLRCRVTNTLDGLTAVGYSPTITVNMIEP